MVVSGAGAAGVACTKILLAAGIGDIAVADSRGIVHSGRGDLTPVKAELAAMTNRAGYTGTLEDALAGADVFLGLSAGKVGEEAVATMADNAIIFALANPDPEVPVEVARRHAAVVATGRSDYPNQINNVLAFPGIFAGAFDAGARQITENMKLAAAEAIGVRRRGRADAGQDRADPVRPAGGPGRRGRRRRTGREGRSGLRRCVMRPPVHSFTWTVDAILGGYW